MLCSEGYPGLLGLGVGPGQLHIHPTAVETHTGQCTVALCYMLLNARCVLHTRKLFIDIDTQWGEIRTSAAVKQRLQYLQFLLVSWSSASSEKPHLTGCKGEKRLLIGRGRYLQCEQCNTSVIGELHQISTDLNVCMSYVRCMCGR